MYRNYEDYEKKLEEMKANETLAGVKIKKKTREEFEWSNYQDKVEMYLVEEWGTEYFHQIFYGNVEDWESEELTPEEIRGDELHSTVHEIIYNCYGQKLSVNQTAEKVLEFLKKEQAV